MCVCDKEKAAEKKVHQIKKKGKRKKCEVKAEEEAHLATTTTLPAQVTEWLGGHTHGN